MGHGAASFLERDYRRWSEGFVAQKSVSWASAASLGFGCGAGPQPGKRTANRPPPAPLPLPPGVTVPGGPAVNPEISQRRGGGALPDGDRVKMQLQGQRPITSRGPHQEALEALQRTGDAKPEPFKQTVLPRTPTSTSRHNSPFGTPAQNRECRHSVGIAKRATFPVSAQAQVP
jgi:hypothetical protein